LEKERETTARMWNSKLLRKSEIDAELRFKDQTVILQKRFEEALTTEGKQEIMLRMESMKRRKQQLGGKYGN
jgi:hypothetical protein